MSYYPMSMCFNSLWPSDAIRHLTSLSVLVQVMAWHLFGAKPLPESMQISSGLNS